MNKPSEFVYNLLCPIVRDRSLHSVKCFFSSNFATGKKSLNQREAVMILLVQKQFCNTGYIFTGVFNIIYEYLLAT